jgi:hypothetical protein
MNKVVHAVPGGTVTVRRRTVEYRFDDLVDPADHMRWVPGGVNADGQAQVRQWIDRLFHDAEQVRHLSKRYRMIAFTGAGSGGVRFATPYTAAEVAQWAEALCAVLRDPRYLKTLDPAPPAA